jgi:hypothetical protein
MTTLVRMLPWVLLAVTAGAAAEAPEAPEALEATAAAPLALTGLQQQAVGIRVEHPLSLASAPQIEAFGTVLDPAALVADLGRVASTAAAASAASADAARIGRLYRDEEQASLKSLQMAQAQSVEAEAGAHAAALGFRLAWGPLADLGAGQRRALVDGLTRGRRALLRAAVPGYQVHGALAPRALVDVDGVQVAAHVLGPLARSDPQSQTGSWLIELDRAPPGLGPGARAVVWLEAPPALRGVLVPAAALIYSDAGAYVYRQQGGGDTFHYTVAPVRVLARVGSGWLVGGLASTDLVVVQGAGVLWSIQGVGSFSAAEEEHD